jgi:4-hydroxy-tetrahydrodipicolinate synthase
MTTNPIFRGVATAIITPTNANCVDYESFGRIIDWQIAEGINAIVVCGTTGENPTLSDDEHKECIRFCVERVAHRVPVIAGTGSNDTGHAIMMTQYACAIGASAVLCVTPYYNRPTQTGLIASYTAIADASSVPVILYNVPSRTGIGIAAETYAALAEHPNINGVKEASGDFSLIAKTRSLCGDDLFLWSGNDDNTVGFMALGGQGVISVLSNLLPAETAKLCSLCLEGDFPAAAALQARLLPLMKALFLETNPIPVKKAMQWLGEDSGLLRLPLVEMGEEAAARLRAAMREYGLVV